MVPRSVDGSHKTLLAPGLPRSLTRRLDNGLATVEQDHLEIEVPLHAAQDVVADDVAVAEVEQRLALGANHRGANTPIFHGATLVVVPECGHSAYWEQPDIFNRTVLEFLKKH